MLPATIAEMLNKLQRRVAYLRKLKRGTPIIVYQMGKVGSASIKNSLESCGVEPVFHVHRMNPIAIQRIRQKDMAMNRTPLDYWLAEMLFADIIQKGKMAKIITLVREPISRSISTFFQNFARFTGVEYEDANFTIGELITIFLERGGHSVPLAWFDVELKQVLRIDVYEYPFPKEKGYLSIKKVNFELLLIKSEVDDSIKEQAIAEFLGMKDFRLIRSNVADDKSYSRTYRSFLETVELPESYVEIMCSSEYIRHFYTDAEIEAIRSKWRNRVSRTELPLTVHQGLLRASSRHVD